jgi:hypothetical protein
MFDYETVGNIHIHSHYSDGAGDVREIAEAASKVGLDFICLNDHHFMTDSLHLDEEGYHGDVLVLMGLEIGRRYHHYLAYDLRTWINGKGLGPQEIIDQVNQQGGFGFLAHPFEKGMPFSEGSVAYTWNDLSVEGFTGICIWNFTSRWKERIKTFLHGLYCLALKKQSLKPPSRETLAFWDRLCQEERVVAIGGSDAHGSLFQWRRLSFTPLSYDFLLNSINIHLLVQKRLPKDHAEAKDIIYEAMRAGRLFVAHDNLSDARGSRFEFVAEDGSNLLMVEEGDSYPGELFVELPQPGEIRLLRDGEMVRRWRGRESVYHVEEKGVYRVEIYKHVFLFGWRPWIYSNPIYLR